MPMSNLNKALMNEALAHAEKYGWISAYVLADHLLYLRDWQIVHKRADKIAYTTLRTYAAGWRLQRLAGRDGAGILGLWKKTAPDSNPRTPYD